MSKASSNIKGAGIHTAMAESKLMAADYVGCMAYVKMADSSLKVAETSLKRCNVETIAAYVTASKRLSSVCARAADALEAACAR